MTPRQANVAAYTWPKADVELLHAPNPSVSARVGLNIIGQPDYITLLITSPFMKAITQYRALMRRINMSTYT